MTDTTTRLADDNDNDDVTDDGTEEAVGSGSRPAPAVTEGTVRVDKWLWAARCFKSRSQATEACTSGQVRVNEREVKASQPVKAGDLVDVVCPGGRRILQVRGLGERRGSAEVARGLYDDLTPPPPPRPDKDAEPGIEGPDPGGRPDKRDRRTLRRLRDRW